MLEAIADFWKPAKKILPQVKMRLDDIQIGSTISFSSVPQGTLSGRKLSVTAINTYQFGADVLTSYVLSQDKDAGASMILAETEGEPYLALSRRIFITDRNRMFQQEDIDAIIHNDATSGLECREITSDYKGWLVSSYTRNMRGMKGRLFKGDYRGVSLERAQAQNFSYTLLISESGEHALELEAYDDGRVEIYATVYRRLADVSEITHPAIKEISRPDVKLVSNSQTSIEIPPSKSEPVLQAAPPLPKKNDVPEIVAQENTPITSEDKPAEKTSIPTISDVKEEVSSTPIALPEFDANHIAKKFDEQAVKAKADELLAMLAKKPAITIKSNNTQPYFKQEIKAVNKEPSNFVNESIDCELHVANKIIDEAIRQEMRINDVVRRVIGLPVSQQESVQIPVTLTDQDYALLAIRYAISSNDREAIKKRINDDLNDFSGANKKKAA